MNAFSFLFPTVFFFAGKPKKIRTGLLGRLLVFYRNFAIPLRCREQRILYELPWMVRMGLLIEKFGAKLFIQSAQGQFKVSYPFLHLLAIQIFTPNRAIWRRPRNIVTTQKIADFFLCRARNFVVTLLWNGGSYSKLFEVFACSRPR